LEIYLDTFPDSLIGTTIKKIEGYWIKNPDTTKYVHVEFLAYEYITEDRIRPHRT